MNDARRTVGWTARIVTACLLAMLVLSGVLGAAHAERVYFPAKGSQNGFTKACREAGAAPKREASRVVSCTKMDSDGDAHRITCNFKTNQCWRALELPGGPTRNDHAIEPDAGVDPGQWANPASHAGGAVVTASGGLEPDGQ